MKLFVKTDVTAPARYTSCAFSLKPPSPAMLPPEVLRLAILIAVHAREAEIVARRQRRRQLAEDVVLPAAAVALRCAGRVMSGHDERRNVHRHHVVVNLPLVAGEIVHAILDDRAAERARRIAAAGTAPCPWQRRWACRRRRRAGSNSRGRATRLLPDLVRMLMTPLPERPNSTEY